MRSVRVSARLGLMVVIALVLSALSVGFASAAGAATYGSPLRVGPYFQFPTGVAVDRAGNVFVADPNSSSAPVAKISADRSTTTAFGSGFARPQGVAVDSAGNVFVADTGNSRVVEVSADGSNQSTIGSGFTAPTRVAVDSTGNVFVVDGGYIYEVPTQGSQRQINAGAYASAVAIDTKDNVYVAAGGSGTVIKLTPPYDQSSSTAIGSGLNAPLGLASDENGNVFVDSTFDNEVVQISPDGNKTTVATGLKQPYGVDVDRIGNLFIADSGNFQVLELPVQRDVATSTTVTCGPAAPAGTSQQCTATVTASGSSATPTGAVAFSSSGDGTFAHSGTCTLDSNGSCSLAFTPSSFGTGSQGVTAKYQGDNGFMASSGDSKITVAASPTSTRVACSPTAVATGSNSSCTVTVTNTAGNPSAAPTGTVTVRTSTSGLASSSCALSASGDGASATCKVTDTPTPGTQTITANYPASDAFLPSSGQATVAAADATRTALVCSPSGPFLHLAACVVMVTNTAARPSAPTGTVTFSGTTGLTATSKTCALLGSGSTTACAVIVSTNNLAKASLTASYAGNATQASSVSTVPIVIF